MPKEIRTTSENEKENIKVFYLNDLGVLKLKKKEYKKQSTQDALQHKETLRHKKQDLQRTRKNFIQKLIS